MSDPIESAITAEHSRQEAAQPLTPTTQAELLANAWARLDDSTLTRSGSGSELRYVTKAELSEFMAEAALLALGAAGLHEPVTPKGDVQALLQSLRVMGTVAADSDLPGHKVVADRAVGFIGRLSKDVTRFLTYPGMLVKHVTVEHDLQVLSVRFDDGGRAWCQCVPAGVDVPVQHQFQLGELNAAGPVDDFVRIAVAGLSRAMVDDAVERALFMVGNGVSVPGFADGGEVTLDRPTGVDHLQAHPEYVMTPGGKHAEVVTDECTECHRDLHNCTCPVPNV